MTALLSVEGVVAAYGDAVALREVSLEVGEGEIVALVGANGAGKTTLLKAVAGLLRPRQGAIRMAGERIDGRPPHDIVTRGVALVPEGRRVFPQMTVSENLVMGSYHRAARAHRRERMERVFALFPRLAERITQRAGSLSGGEQQMLAIGRGLMAGPRLLLLDEPSLGLAPTLVDAVLAAVTEINREGMAVLLVEQNAPQALEVAHRGYVLANGRLAAAGAAGDLLRASGFERAYFGLGQ
ncbi:MAG: ABC transporter ATP-binding protein [candidate division NC10 bacterium]